MGEERRRKRDTEREGTLRSAILERKELKV